MSTRDTRLSSACVFAKQEARACSVTTGLPVGLSHTISTKKKEDFYRYWYSKQLRSCHCVVLFRDDNYILIRWRVGVSAYVFLLQAERFF